MNAATAPAVVPTPGGDVAVLPVAATLPPESAAGPGWPGVAPVRVRYAFAGDESPLAEQPGTVPDVRTRLDERDVERVRAAVAAARSASDAVLGNHAHELHGIEFHRDRPIACCLGNVWIGATDAHPWMGRASIALRLTLHPGAAPDVAVVPLLLDGGGVPRADPDWRAVRLLAERGRELGATVDVIGDRYVLRLKRAG